MEITVDEEKLFLVAVRYSSNKKIMTNSNLKKHKLNSFIIRI